MIVLADRNFSAGKLIAATAATGDSGSFQEPNPGGTGMPECATAPPAKRSKSTANSTLSRESRRARLAPALPASFTACRVLVIVSRLVFGAELGGDSSDVGVWVGGGELVQDGGQDSGVVFQPTQQG